MQLKIMRLKYIYAKRSQEGGTYVFENINISFFNKKEKRKKKKLNLLTEDNGLD